MLPANQHAFPVTPISAEYATWLEQEIGLIRTGKSDFDTAMAAFKSELMTSLQQALAERIARQQPEGETSEVLKTSEISRGTAH